MNKASSNLMIHVDLTGNPVQCDCCMAWLKQYEIEFAATPVVMNDIMCLINADIPSVHVAWHDLNLDYVQDCQSK